MINIKNIDHLVLRTSRPNQLIAFYTKVLNCPVERELEIGLIQLRAGSCLIDIIPVDSQLEHEVGESLKPTNKNLDHFCLRVEPFNIEEIYQFLDNHQVEYQKVATRYGAEGNGPSIYIKDPDGNTVELKGPAERIDSN